LHGEKVYVILTKSFVKIWIAKTFCENNKMFSSVNKTFGCCSKTFGIAATKVLFVVPNFVTVTKPFFHCGKIIFEKSVAGAKSVCEWLKPGD